MDTQTPLATVGSAASLDTEQPPATLEVTAEPSAPESAVAPQPLTWDDIAPFLETATPEQLRRHPRIAGIAGELANRLAEERLGRLQADQETLRQQQQAHAEWQRLAREDPETFAQQYLQSEAARTQQTHWLDQGEQRAHRQWLEEVFAKYDPDGRYRQAVASGQLPGPGAMVEALIEEHTQKRAGMDIDKRMAEMEKRFEERLRSLARLTEPGPERIEGTPTGTQPNSDDAFIAAYAAGDEHDHERARRIYAALMR